LRTGGSNRANILIISAGLLACAQSAIAQQVAGRVVDAVTGAPLVGSVVRIPALQQFVLTNRDGIFRLPARAAGAREISIDHLGYATRLVEFDSTASQLLEIKLEPQPVVLERLTVLHDRLEERRKRGWEYSQVFTREDILSATTSNPVDFLQLKGGLKTVPCPAVYANQSAVCVLQSTTDPRMQPRRRSSSGNVARRFVPIIVFVDDQPIAPRGFHGGDLLQAYALQDFYRIETYEFGGHIVRAYTNGYMQRMTGARAFVDNVIWQHADAIADQERARPIR
jgi:hypothetical protein